SLRIGRQDFQPGSGQIRPITDAERIAWPDGDDYQRSRNDAPILIRLPVAPDQTGLRDPGHVALQREPGDGRLAAAEYGARLRPVGLMRLLNLTLLPLLPLPPFLKFGNDRLAARRAGRRVSPEQ